MTPRRHRDVDATPPRRRRDATATSTRRRRDAAATPPRRRRDIAATPHNEAEQFLAVFLMICGAMLWGYVIGTFCQVCPTACSPDHLYARFLPCLPVSARVCARVCVCVLVCPTVSL